VRCTASLRSLALPSPFAPKTAKVLTKGNGDEERQNRAPFPIISSLSFFLSLLFFSSSFVRSSAASV